MVPGINNENVKSKFLTLLFIGLLILAIVFRWVNHGWEHIVDSDGRGYFSYLPALFTYFDLDFRYFFSGKLNVPADYTYNFLFIIDGHYVIKYPPGVALLLSPFYIVATVLSIVFGFELTGYSFFYQIFVSIAAIVYCVFGVRNLLEIFRRYNIGSNISLWIVLSLVFGTNLLVYVIHEPSMSHVYSFAAVSGFLLYLKRWIDGESNKNLLIAALFLGVTILIRPVNGIVVFAVLLLFNSSTELGGFIKKLLGNIPLLLKCAFIASLVIFIQPLLWYLENGHWYVWTYLGESFKWDHPEITKVLFSFRKGWLLYTPLMLLLIPAFISMIVRKEVVKIIGFIVFWTSAIYMISSWWCWYYGGSFGQRAFIEFYPIAALSFIPLLHFIKDKTVFLKVFLIVCVLLNIIQSYQYRNNILHYDSMDKKKYFEVFLRTGKEYEWKVFYNENEQMPDDIKDRPVIVKSFADFESCNNGIPDWNPCHSDYSDVAVSGNHVALFGAEYPYSPAFNKPLNGELKEPSIFVRGFINVKQPKNESRLIISIKDADGNEIYKEDLGLKDLISKGESNYDGFSKFEFRSDIKREAINPTVNIYLMAPSEQIKLDDLYFCIFKK